eukprot:5719984-Pyramimonas_sp.AAC.1
MSGCFGWVFAELLALIPRRADGGVVLGDLGVEDSQLDGLPVELLLESPCDGARLVDDPSARDAQREAARGPAAAGQLAARIGM